MDPPLTARSLTPPYSGDFRLAIAEVRVGRSVLGIRERFSRSESENDGEMDATCETC